MIGNGLACADVIGLGRINVLHHVVEETPFLNHVALHIHLDNGVHLALVAI